MRRSTPHASFRRRPALVALLCTVALAACDSETRDALSALEALGDAAAEEADPSEAVTLVSPDAPRAAIPVLGASDAPVTRLGVMELEQSLTESEIGGRFGTLAAPLDAARLDRIERPILETCTVLADVPIDDAFAVMDDAELDFATGLDAGEPITIGGPDGTWTRAERSSLQRDYGPQGYFDRRAVQTPMPQGALLEVPGAEFPAMRVELPTVIRPGARRAGGANPPTGFVFDGRYEWTPGERPDSQWIEVAVVTTLPGDPFRGTGVACRALDDGSFTMPAEALDAIEGNGLLGVDIHRRSDVVVRDGDAMLHVRITAGLI